MALSDEIASRVLGELHQLTTKIDEQQKQIKTAALVVRQSAELIQINSDNAVNNAREASRHAQQESVAQIQIVLTHVVAKTLSQVAGAVALRSATKWVLFGVLLAGVLTVSAGWVAYKKGKEAGTQEGYSRTRNEVAASSWANTHEGNLAIQLSEAGSLTALATCDPRRGWKLDENICHPQTTRDGIYGWRVRKKK
jgi:hypothetical protein